MACLAQYPEAKERVTRAARRVAMQRALLKHLAKHNGKRMPNSFVPRSAAEGYSEVQEQRTLEQKVDALLAISQQSQPQRSQSQSQSPSRSQSPTRSQQSQQQSQSRSHAPPPSPHTLPPIGINGGGGESATQMLTMMHEQRSDLTQLKRVRRCGSRWNPMSPDEP